MYISRGRGALAQKQIVEASNPSCALWVSGHLLCCCLACAWLPHLICEKRGPLCQDRIGQRKRGSCGPAWGTKVKVGLLSGFAIASEIGALFPLPLLDSTAHLGHVRPRLSTHTTEQSPFRLANLFQVSFHCSLVTW